MNGVTTFIDGECTDATPGQAAPPRHGLRRKAGHDQRRIDEIPTIFDADNHYWETSDSFTRHRDPKFAERGCRR